MNRSLIGSQGANHPSKSGGKSVMAVAVRAMENTMSTITEERSTVGKFLGYTVNRPIYRNIDVKFEMVQGCVPEHGDLFKKLKRELPQDVMHVTANSYACSYDVTLVVLCSRDEAGDAALVDIVKRIIAEHHFPDRLEFRWAK